MTWGVVEPSNYGFFSPDGRFIGYKESVEHYFFDVLSEGERDELRGGGSVRFPSSKFSEKFVKDCGPLTDYEQPKFYKTQKTYIELASMVILPSMLIAVDEALKAIIEELEPDVHQFWPIEIVMPKDVSYPVQYYGMVINNHLNSFRPAETRSDLVTDKSVGDYVNYHVFAKSRSNFKDIAISRDEVGRCHVWREKYVGGLWVLVSDELAARIKLAGLRVPKRYPMKDV